MGRSPFHHGNHVILKSAASGHSLKIDKAGKVSGDGGQGEWATFIVHVVDKKTNRKNRIIKLQNVGDNKHWLRITSNGNLDGEGSGGEWCDFEVERISEGGNHFFSLKSHKSTGRVGILENGTAKEPSKTGTGINGRFTVTVVKGVQPRKGFFYTGKQVIFQSVASGKSLRIDKDGHVDGNGGHGEWATFTVELVSPSDRSKKKGAVIRLRNVGNKDHFLRITENKTVDGKGSGGKWCEFEVEKIVEGNQKFFCLKSVAHSGSGNFRIGVLNDGSIKNPGDTGHGPHGRFICLNAKKK